MVYKPKSKKGNSKKTFGKKTNGVKPYHPEVKSSPVDEYVSSMMNSCVLEFPPEGATMTLKPTCLNCTTTLNSIAQGTGNGRRIGNKIQLKSLWFKSVFNNTDVADLRLCYKLVFCRIKGSDASPTLTHFQKLFQSGSTNSGPSNTLFEQYKNFNTDVFTILKVVSFKLSPAQSNYNIITKGGFGVYKTVFVDLAKYLPKTIKYDENAVNTTNTGGIYAFILASSINDPALIAPETTQFYQVQHSATITAEYTDP